MTDLILCFIAMMLVGIFVVLVGLGNRIIEHLDSEKEDKEVRRIQDDAI